MKRLEQVFTHWNRQVVKLKQKCTDFSNGIVRAMIEEEMQLRREEGNARVRTPQRGEQLPGA
jgi:hypothetical protein